MHCCAGDIKLIIAAKVDVRDGVAWSSLDKYIKNIEGVAPHASSLQTHSSEPEAAAAVTAAGVADTEEDADAAAGMPFIRDSSDTGMSSTETSYSMHARFRVNHVCKFALIITAILSHQYKDICCVLLSLLPDANSSPSNSHTN